MRNIKRMTAVLLAAVVVSVTGCGSETQEAKNKESAKTASEALEAALDAVEEQNKAALNTDLGSNEGIDLSSYESVYTFTLDGTEMHLSGDVGQLLDDGWVFSNDDVTMDGTEVVTLNEAVQKGTMFDAIETPDFNMYKTKDGKTYQMMVGIYSDTVEPKTLPEFHLGYLYLDEEMGLPLEMKTGITFGSTIDEVKEVYGEPVSEASNLLYYHFSDEDMAFMPDRPEFLNFYLRDGKVYMISMQYFPVLSK